MLDNSNYSGLLMVGILKNFGFGRFHFNLYE